MDTQIKVDSIQVTSKIIKYCRAHFHVPFVPSLSIRDVKTTQLRVTRKNFFFGNSNPERKGVCSQVKNIRGGGFASESGLCCINK